MKKINKKKLQQIEGGTTGQMCLLVGAFGSLFYAYGGVGIQSTVGSLASYCWNS